jgi:hypothetical protein
MAHDGLGHGIVDLGYRFVATHAPLAEIFGQNMESSMNIACIFYFFPRIYSLVFELPIPGTSSR